MSIAHQGGMTVRPSHLLTWTTVMQQTRSLYENCVYRMRVGGVQIIIGVDYAIYEHGSYRTDDGLQTLC